MPDVHRAWEDDLVSKKRESSRSFREKSVIEMSLFFVTLKSPRQPSNDVVVSLARAEVRSR
ncbi:hypothetical protein GCM10009304_25850 [Pseudomonas matsuisoli]|uniref:Uncharacterized protein n=1 Tax=Pseudomonas matsuisoli TaxID=1515666 RepID=A0A917UZ02_9PSED|nr:hypothetical protein GCM10009304_25850 [Pseudomonas matsuisoli]